MNRFVTALTILALRLSSDLSHVHAFTPARILTGSSRHASSLGYCPSSPCPSKSFRRQWLHAATTDEIEAVSSMRAGAIKKELESYGISTAAFLEKSELVEALVDARAKGLKPIEQRQQATSSGSDKDSSSSSSSTTTSTDSQSREVRLKEEMEKLKNVKASEMKKELEERGISTASFFEKSEFLKALAEARVDGIDNKKKKKKRRGNEDDNGEGYAEYANVEVITDDSAGPRRKQSEASGGRGGGGGADPFAGASPFGGMGGMPAGMGGMGGFADILNNLGGMGGFGGGANPFGGMGGMGGMGDMMGKAQELMKNPKVMELMMKAQKNPKVMAAMQECMSNPSAFAKYRNDPEVSELIRELEKYM